MIDVINAESETGVVRSIAFHVSITEIKDEYKRLEGDPTIKQRQREIQREMSQGRQSGAVPGADVVVTNPIHYAVALKYDEENTVTGSGDGWHRDSFSKQFKAMQPLHVTYFPRSLQPLETVTCDHHRSV